MVSPLSSDSGAGSQDTKYEDLPLPSRSIQYHGCVGNCVLSYWLYSQGNTNQFSELR